MSDVVRYPIIRALRKKLIRVISEKIEMLEYMRQLNIQLNDYSGIPKIEKKLELLRKELNEIHPEKK